jgi:hypothetical protein
MGNLIRTKKMFYGDSFVALDYRLRHAARFTTRRCASRHVARYRQRR